MEKATTHEGKHVCALGWFRCVQKMHEEICHREEPLANDEPVISNKHKHHSTTTKSPHSVKPTKTPAPCGCRCRYDRCNAHARTVPQRDACIRSFAKCVKSVCHTEQKCDPNTRKCLKNAKTHTQKLKCVKDWFMCVKKYKTKICHKPKFYDYSHHKHHSTTTKKPSITTTRTPAKCGCYCQYTRCNGHARTVKEKDACIKSYATCVKRFCDTTKQCDPKARKCMKKAKTHTKKLTCAKDWFKCVKKYQKKICHKQTYYDISLNKRHFHSTTTQKPSKPTKTPAHSGCYSRWRVCFRRSHTQIQKDRCLRSYAGCVKKTCDTRKCDAPAKQCYARAETKSKRRVCATKWFQCTRATCHD